jgi:hypothetical protein
VALYQVLLKLGKVLLEFVGQVFLQPLEGIGASPPEALDQFGMCWKWPASADLVQQPNFK